VKTRVGRRDWDVDFDQRLVLAEIEHSAGVDVGALAAGSREVGPSGSLSPLRGMNVRPSPFQNLIWFSTISPTVTTAQSADGF
jgi:hypothetical protein